MRTAVLVTVGRARYWANLDWETIPANEDRAARFRELQATVGKRGLRCIRPCPGYDMYSLGYAGPPAGVSRAPTHPALAGAVADARTQPWIGVFQLAADRDQWWLVAITEGQSIIPGGDVVGTRAEIEAARQAVSGLKDWAFFDGDLADLQGFLQDARSAAGKPAQAHVFVWRPSIWHLATVAAVIAALVGASIWHHREERAARQAALAAARLRLEALREKLSLAQARAAARRPWHRVIRPAPFTTACLAAIGRLPIDRWGWSPQEVRCGLQGEVNVTWRRGAGATTRHAPRGQLQAGGNTIEEQGAAALRVQAPGRAGRALPANGVLRRAFYAWAQSRPVTLTLTDTSHPTVTLPGVHPARVRAGARSLFVVQHAQVVTDFPETLLSLDQLPGVRIESLTVAEPLSAAPLWTATLRYWLTARSGTDNTPRAAAPSAP